MDPFRFTTDRGASLDRSSRQQLCLTVGFSWHAHVHRVLEVGELHDLVVLNRQRVAFESASRPPWTGDAPSFPLEGQDAV